MTEDYRQPEAPSYSSNTDGEHPLAGAAGSASSEAYDPLNSLEREVERFMQTNRFTPMEVTGFYLQARCVISELKRLRQENEYFRNLRDRQTAIIRQRDAEIIELEEQVIALSPNNEVTHG